MTTWRATLSAAILVLGAGLVGGCSSGGGGGGGGNTPCDNVCNCVQSGGGDRADCMNQCSQLVSQGAGSSVCESRLDSEGFPECKTHCAAFD